MEPLQQFDGENGLFKIVKAKILYEVKSFENHFIIKNFDTNTYRVIVNQK